jgi:hypothetical protein
MSGSASATADTGAGNNATATSAVTGLFPHVAHSPLRGERDSRQLMLGAIARHLMDADSLRK